MADLSKLSDQELLAMHEQGQKPDLSKMSDAELLKLYKQDQKPADERPWYDMSGGGLVRGALKALPAAGATVGGLAGSLVTPFLGTLVGAGAGGVAGKSLQSAGESLLLNEGPKTRGEHYTQLAGAGLDGVSQEMGGQAIGKGIDAIGKGLKSAPGLIASKVEHVFGKDNPISNHVAEGLETYKSQFQFPKDSTVEKHLTNLISKVKSTPPSQWTAAEIDGITKRIGPEAIHEAIAAGEQKLGEVGKAIFSEHPNAMTEFLNPLPLAEKEAPGAMSKAVDWTAKKIGGGLGAAAGAMVGHALPIPGLESAMGTGGYFAGKKMADMALNAMKMDPELAAKLGQEATKHFEGRSLSALLNSPEAKEIMLHHFLEKGSAPPPEPGPPGEQMNAAAKMSTNIRSKLSLGK